MARENSYRSDAQPRSPRGRKPEGFHGERALELLRLTGKAYVDYFEQRFGGDASLWEPRSGVEKYGRYRPGALPSSYRLDLRITWQAGRQRVPIGFLIHSRNESFLVFRGTVSEQEWFKDVQVAQRERTFDLGGETETVGLHTGFDKIYESLEPHPSDLIGRLESRRLFVTGHSLGGALATLAALRLSPVRPELYTFASPRVGDGRLARLCRRHLAAGYRVFNQWDPVVETPDADLDLIVRRYRYEHVGEALRLYSLTQIDGESIAELVAGGVDLKSYILMGKRPDLLFAHQLRTYEYALLKYMHRLPGQRRSLAMRLRSFLGLGSRST